MDKLENQTAALLYGDVDVQQAKCLSFLLRNPNNVDLMKEYLRHNVVNKKTRDYMTQDVYLPYSNQLELFYKMTEAIYTQVEERMSPHTYGILSEKLKKTESDLEVCSAEFNNFYYDVKTFITSKDYLLGEDGQNLLNKTKYLFLNQNT